MPVNDASWRGEESVNDTDGAARPAVIAVVVAERLVRVPVGPLPVPPLPGSKSGVVRRW